MSESTPASPTRLADFEIIRRLGAGGMAEVFLAKKQGAQGTHKLLVVKRILPTYTSSRRFRTMFAEEAQLATRLNHPNIVQVYDFQDYGDDGQLLSMEYVEGPDLRKLYRAAKSAGRRLPPYVAAYVTAEVAKGLHYAHERKNEDGRRLDIVHRDVSPQNILVSFDGSVKIADFGIATANVLRDESGVLKGKTGYMSPEQARGESVDRRTDIYSLGVVLHELLAGRPLHGAASGHDLLEAVRLGHVEPPSMFVRDVPPEIEEIAMRALARDREERFQSARDFAAAVARVLFQKGLLIDAPAVEQVVEEFVGREHTSPGVTPEVAEGADIPSRAEDQASQAGVEEEEEDIQLGKRAGREVRHIVVVTLHLHGLDEMRRIIGWQPTERLLSQLKATFGEIAYKRGTSWSWTAEPSAVGPADAEVKAKAIVGLIANPSQAASDAAWLAVDVHEAVAGACDGLPVSLKTSIGIVRAIATGRRDQQGRLVQHRLQPPADELAELLGRRAQPGDTWVAGGLYRLVRRDFVWGEVPTIEIGNIEQTDLPRTIRAYILKRPLTREERLAQRAFAARDLIGRDAELADLHAAFHQALANDPKLNGGVMTSRVVIGEMGIGKTALVNAFLRELPPEARVTRIECSPAQRDIPLSNLGEWLRGLTGTKPKQPTEEAYQTILDTLGMAATTKRDESLWRMAELATGQLALAADEADVAYNRRLLNAGLRTFLRQSALSGPVVFVLDSAQWADPASLELVGSLIRWSDVLPILIILVTRPEEPVSPFIEGMVRIELSGLSTENQVRLIEEHAGATTGVAQACQDLIPRAAGNPFFLLEIVDALLERGGLELSEQGDGGYALVRVEQPGQAESLPSTLEQLIADRLNELPAAERAVIAWLAVARRPMLEEGIKELAGLDRDDALVRLCARGLCDSKADTIDVRHPLTRDVAYAAIELKRRSRMHVALGEYLANTPAASGLGAAMVARHFAEGGENGRAARYYLEAAMAAHAGYQLQLSASYFRRVLAILPDDDLQQLEAYDALENIYRVQGRWRERRDALLGLRRLAKRSKRAGWAATALIRTARYDLDGGRLARGLRLAEQAEVVADRAQLPTLQVEAQSLIAKMLRDLGEMQGALAACDRALKTCAGAPVDARLRAEVLRARGTLLLRVGRVQEAVDAQAEAIAVFRQEGARRLEARAKNSLAWSMFVLGKFEDAIALALEAIRIDLAIGGRFQIAKTLANIGQAYARLGDFQRADAYFRRARDAHQRYGDQDGRADTLLASAEALIEQGDLTAADGFIGDAAALSRVTGSTFDGCHEKLLRAILARVRGDMSQSLLLVQQARQQAEARAYIAFHFYAMALEALLRVETGEEHSGILLATTALGAIETLQGSQYGLETRLICLDAFAQARSPQAGEVRSRAIAFIEKLRGSIRDPELRAKFSERPAVARLLVGESQRAQG